MLPEVRVKPIRHPPPADLAEALARAAEECDDSRLRRWVESLAEGEHAASATHADPPAAQQEAAS
jgi:hypothetical protein